MSTRQYDSATDLITFSRASNATYLDSDGLIKTASSNTPRIEYDTDGNVLGLLVEEARTNLEANSNAFSMSELTKAGSTANFRFLDENVATAPDGTQSANKLVESTNLDQQRVYKGYTVVSGQPYTWSVFLKAGERTEALLRTTSNSGASFDLSAGTVSLLAGDSATIEDVGNGWYRCAFTFTSAATTEVPWIAILNGVTDDYTGDGSSGIYIWGAQLEAGSFPTSYIPTSGATATRTADVASIPVADFGYNQSEGTVVVDFNTPNALDNDRIAVISTGTAYRVFDISRSGLDLVTYSTEAGPLGLGSFTAESKVAVTFKSGKEFAGVQNGGTVATDSFTTEITKPTTLFIGSWAAISDRFPNGHIKSIKYFPRRLTNAQLQELTA